MSDFGPSGDDTRTAGDVWRYVWLGVLGTLVLLLLLSRVRGTFVILLAIYLVAASAVGLLFLLRARRS